MAQHYQALGIMSGSSLDGIDMAYCEFQLGPHKKNHFKIVRAETVSYNEEWQNILSQAHLAKGNKLIEYHLAYGRYLGQAASAFLKKYDLQPDLIASHGHTVFHQPGKGYTFQLGHGQAIATYAGCTVVSDFRIKDIVLGGEGAPLVPVGDELLFPEYEICLNIGGITNLSYKENGRRVAFDICPANQILNALSRQKGYAFDRAGEMAKSGMIIPPLLKKLDQDRYYSLPFPKSLSNEYVTSHFIQAISAFSGSPEDKLRTSVEHIASQIGHACAKLAPEQILVTGGGAHNTFLMRRLEQLTGHRIVVPDTIIVDFKEALIFAFMGVLRMRNGINSFASVTGAKQDSSCGVVYLP